MTYVALQSPMHLAKLKSDASSMRLFSPIYLSNISIFLYFPKTWMGDTIILINEHLRSIFFFK